MVPRPQFPPRDNAGLTIVELVAVLCVGGVVVAIVMLSLAFMTRQTLVQRHMAAFQAQTSRADLRAALRLLPPPSMAEERYPPPTLPTIEMT